MKKAAVNLVSCRYYVRRDNNSSVEHMEQYQQWRKICQKFIKTEIL